MDNLSNAYDSNLNRWNELARAIEEVDTLPLDDRFVQVIDKYAIFEKSSFQQEDYPLCLNNNDFFKGSYFTKYLQERHIVLQDTEISLHRQGDTYSAQGYFVLNDSNFEIKSINGSLFAQDITRDLPPVPIEPHDITAFFAAIASQFSDEKIGCVSAFGERLGSAPDDWSKLMVTISLMGNFTGLSSHTVRSLLPGDNQAIIVEMSEIETPDNSDLHNQLLLGTVSDLDDLTREIGLLHHQISQADTYTPDERAATHAVTTRHVSLIDAALEKNPFTSQPGMVLSHYSEDSGPEEVRKYALLCQELMEAYAKLSGVDS